MAAAFHPVPRLVVWSTTFNVFRADVEIIVVGWRCYWKIGLQPWYLGGKDEKSSMLVMMLLLLGVLVMIVVIVIVVVVVRLRHEAIRGRVAFIDIRR